MKATVVFFLLISAFSVSSAIDQFDFLHLWTDNCDAIYNATNVRREDGNLVLEKKPGDALFPQSYLKFSHRNRDARKLL